MSDKKEDKSFSFVDKRRLNDDGEKATDPEESEVTAAGSAEPPKGSDGKDKSEQASAPPIDFVTFILSLSQSALYHLGGFADPVSGKTSVNLDLAKQTIEIIDMLKEKTEGNLSDDESKVITNMLYDIKMKFVECSRGGGRAAS